MLDILCYWIHRDVVVFKKIGALYKKKHKDGDFTKRVVIALDKICLNEKLQISKSKREICSTGRDNYIETRCRYGKLNSEYKKVWCTLNLNLNRPKYVFEEWRTNFPKFCPTRFLVNT